MSKDKFYYKDGTISNEHDLLKILHRVDGPAVERTNGTKYWFVDDKYHRLDGPAVERTNGTKYWFVDDKYHRLDGPAAESADGYKEWWIDNKEYIEQDFNELIKEINKMSLAMKLTDPRWWVRELGEREVG
jgi:hypothetical protein